MSLTVNANPSSSIAPIPQGSYLAVCNMLVDLGVQYNETFKNSSRKVQIGWEIPEETVEIDGEPKARTISNRYTASLNESSNLRKDLAAWRGRDFTPEELAAFDLRTIVGKSCYVNIIHKERNGKTYANISSIMALPKGTKPGRLTENAIVFDLDTATLDDVDNLPKWLGDIVKQSVTYQEKVTATYQEAIAAPTLEETEDDGELPF